MTTDIAILVLACAAWLNRAQDRRNRFLLVQNRVLQATGGDKRRMTKEHRRALGEAANGLSSADLNSCEPMFTVDTIRRYYRELVIAKWTYPNQGKTGRHPLPAGTVEIVLRISKENPGFGTPGITRRLRAIGVSVSSSSVSRILRAHGIDPAPGRMHSNDWATFLESHAAQITAIDATAVEVLAGNKLVNQWCAMAIHRDTRRVALVGITEHLTEDWMLQQARNLTDPDHGFLRGRRFLLMDRGTNLSAKSRNTLQAVGVEAVRTPPQSPNCNPLIERFFRSLKEECLSHTIPFGQDGLRHLVTEYLEHYHRERPHASLGGQLIDPDPLVAHRSGPIVCRQRLGGLLKFYHRVAA